MALNLFCIIKATIKVSTGIDFINFTDLLPNNFCVQLSQCLQAEHHHQLGLMILNL